MHYLKFISLNNNVINKRIDVSFSYCKLFWWFWKKQKIGDYVSSLLLSILCRHHSHSPWRDCSVAALLCFFHLSLAERVFIYFVVPIQVRKLANPLFTRVCEFFCFTIKTAAEQPLTTARKLMLLPIIYRLSLHYLSSCTWSYTPLSRK